MIFILIGVMRTWTLQSGDERDASLKLYPSHWKDV
jgi:hypothetical protein